MFEYNFDHTSKYPIMRLITAIVITLSILLLTACKTDKSPLSQTATIEKSDIETYLSELAGDKYMGRKPFTKGDRLTVAYIKSEFEKMGLSPGNKASYYQDVPMVEITGYPSEIMSIKTPNKNIDLELSKDFMIHSERPAKKITVEDSELVFCGYGIVDESRGWNDFAGVDMKGKTAVVLINDPGFGSEDTSFFKGDIMTYYGRWTYKYEEADRQGAAGLLLIHETTSAGYPWFVVRTSWAGAQLHLKENRPDDCGMKGWISLDSAKDLFTSCGLDLSKQIRAARQQGFKPVPLNATVTASIKNEIREDNSKNVIAMVKGSKYPAETIVYTAHWDHMGVGQAVEGDSIYNGALDNASGTATVMAIAKAYSQLKQAPERSIVFLMVTAEEQGLLGSAYYAKNPIFDINRTVCNLNMDGVNPIGEMSDFTLTGKGHSEMDEIALEEAKKQDRYVIAEQEPEKGYFFRSDHFNFAKAGVPVLYGGGEVEHRKEGKEYAATQRAEFIAKHYHQPSDEYDPNTWNYDGMVQDGQLYLNIGLRLANSQEWPKWYKSSEFKRK